MLAICLAVLESDGERAAFTALYLRCEGLLLRIALGYFPNDTDRAADAVQAVVDYCTQHYGPLSFGAGESLKLIQSRVVGGGYAADGASLLDEADFTIANLADGAKGAAAGEVFIHEVVHQWWGLGKLFDTADPSSPWSAEGLKG